jgi:GMP synthase-like glutamine amidotransferase
MKTLMISCSFDKNAKNNVLLRAIKKFSEYLLIDFREIHNDYELPKDVDTVILGGSKARIVDPSHRNMFKETLQFIKRVNLPILGICFGHQLLCQGLGCEAATLSEPVIERFEEVRVIEVDDLFTGFKKQQTVCLAQSHYDYVVKNSLDPSGFILLADSPSCEVEAVKHKDKPHYGVQFHPERIEIKGKKCQEGHRIIENFYANVVKR